MGFAETGRVVSIVDGIPGEVQPVEGTNALYAVACTPAFCVAVGSNPANQGVVVIISEVPEPTCTQTLTGDVVGPVTVGSGQTVCVADAARVSGPITVNAGGALILNNAQVTGGIVATNPAFVRICGSQISGPSRTPGRGVVVSGSPVPVTIGDPDAGCAGNRIAGDVVLTGNAGVTLGGNLVSGNATVNNNTGNVVVKANTVFRTLACTGNNPPPVNAGQPNTAATKTGQCAAL